MKTYRVEIFAYTELKAESRREAIREVKENFNPEDLNFDVVDEWEEDGGEGEEEILP